MRRAPHAVIALGLVAAIGVAACGDDSMVSTEARSEVARAASEPGALDPIVQSTNAFAADLFAEINDASDGNVVFSPYSVAVALAMAHAGGRGATADEVLAVLHVGPDLDGGMNALTQELAKRAREFEEGESKERVELAVANSLWGQDGLGFASAFLDTLASQYGAGMRLVDFEHNHNGACQAINRWVEGETNDRIKDLIPDGVLDDMTRLVAVNAIYFKARWQTQFEEAATKEAPFHLLDGKTKPVQMMSMTEGMAYAEGGAWQAVELPYIGGELSMVVVVPSSGAYEEFEAGFDGAQLSAVIGALRQSAVALQLPRFTFTARAALKDPLIALGMPTAFDRDRADFSGITAEEQLYLSEVLHQAFIAVDEHGTEAAAATAAVFKEVGAAIGVAEVTADRPFIFIIRDTKTGAVLFLGRVLDP